MSASSWPESEAGWLAYAAELNARMELLQLHVEPSWLYALCTSCGWDLELGRPDLAQFRHEVACHRCDAATEPVIMLSPVVPVLEEVLF